MESLTHTPIEDVAGRIPGGLRIWWSPRIGIKPFQRTVGSLEEGYALLRALRDYDFYLSRNRQMAHADNIPGGIQEYDPTMIETLDDGRVLSGWVEWYSEDGEDVWEHFKGRADDGQNI